MLKKIALLFTGLITLTALGQDIDQLIVWNFSTSYEGDEATITVTVNQKDGWHIYSQIQPDAAIPIPTSFTFVESEDYSLIGETKEYGSEFHDNEGFPERGFYGKEAKFTQKIKVKSKTDFQLKIQYEFMACKEACLPPADRETEITVKGTSNLDLTGTTDKMNNDPSEIVDTISTIEENETQLDSGLFQLLNSCEGSSYTELFDPVKVKVFDPLRTDEKDYSLSVEIQIDSIFGMYAFNNPKGYKSVFKLRENEQIASISDYELSIAENIGKTGYKYNVTIKQNISLKDTGNAPHLNADLDIYLMGYENNFRNTAPMELSFNLENALDNNTRTKKDSLWLIFILAFIGGFIALLTPCVFPMIPMTVSFFTKQSKTKSEGIRKAIFYAISIILIYVILGVLVTAIAGPTILNGLATNPWMNVIFFVLFVVFAISFLGAFEITLPASWINKADKQADKGGLIGIFFMAFTLALVSFSCTGPIVGSVLVQSAQGGLSGPIVAMLGFSMALALPFGLFAAFPGWLNSLPSSGGWLNTVKVVLGFLELAFALKFLSNADLVLQLHLLERELFLGIWIGIFIVLFIYLIGKIQLPHDSPLEKLSVGRTLLATIVIGFIIYILPGMFGAPLKLISGFPPPLSYSESPYGIQGEAPEIGEDWPESTHPHGHGINTIRDFNDAMDYAKEVDKPVLLDFTGWACVNCRKMEEYVWADETVAPLLANDFIVASLYIDDRGKLPKRYEGERKQDGELMETIGDKWFDFEVSRFQDVSQPMYIVLDHKENNISGKANYGSHSSPEKFREWLLFAKKQYESSKNATIIIPEFVVL